MPPVVFRFRSLDTALLPAHVRQADPAGGRAHRHVGERPARSGPQRLRAAVQTFCDSVGLEGWAVAGGCSRARRI